MTERKAGGTFEISRWTAEFKDRATERMYGQQVMPRSARELRVAVFIWALLLLLFSFNDYVILGDTPEFTQALMSRVVVIVPLLLFFIALGRRPQLVTSGIPLTVLVIYGFIFFFCLYFLYPREAVPYIITVTAVMLISIFVFLPNRPVLAVAAALYGIAGTVVTVALATPADAGSLVGLVVALSLPVILGTIVAYRLNKTRRREYAALLHLEALNEELEQEIVRRRRLEKELEEQANTDPLTGLCNRRFYEKLFEAEFYRARRYDTPLSLIVLDLDRFKDVNDRYGHAAGDEVLREIARICLDDLRITDVVGRLGGEEYVCILPQTGIDGALIIAERLRHRIATTEIEAEGHVLRVTVSLGVTGIADDDGNFTDLIRRADDALYRSKAGGRNMVTSA